MPHTSHHTRPAEPSPQLHPARAAFMISCLVLASMRGLSMMSGDAYAAEPPATPQLHSAEQVYQLALEARTERNYPAMLKLLREAAHAGDVHAQELLGSVLLAGPALYGHGVAANPCEAQQWAQLAAEQGSEVGRHQRAMLNGLRELRQGPAACAAS